MNLREGDVGPKINQSRDHQTEPQAEVLLRLDVQKVKNTLVTMGRLKKAE